MPGPRGWLFVTVDGQPAAEAHSSLLLVPAAPGTHHLRIEALSASHQEYAPPVAVDLRVEVVPSAVPDVEPCPSR